MSIYTLAEFRKNLRKAFNEAESQENVYITRHGEKYVLIQDSYYLELLKPVPEIIKTPAEAVKAVEKIKKVSTPKTKLCPHGYTIDACFDKKADRRCRS
jgi:PHD/YefM family antitoxin component YafN of YafNO toxin-antitoxin module